MVDILARLARPRSRWRGGNSAARSVARQCADDLRPARIAPLSAFLQRHPKVSVELHLDDRLLDPVEGGFDVTVRVAAPASRRWWRAVSATCHACCARARATSQRAALPRIRGSCGSTTACTTATSPAGGSDWSLQRDGEPSIEVPVRGRLCSNNGEALQQAALRDAGALRLSAFRGRGRRPAVAGPRLAGMAGAGDRRACAVRAHTAHRGQGTRLRRPLGRARRQADVRARSLPARRRSRRTGASTARGRARAGAWWCVPCRRAAPPARAQLHHVPAPPSPRRSRTRPRRSRPARDFDCSPTSSPSAAVHAACITRSDARPHSGAARRIRTNAP